MSDLGYTTGKYGISIIHDQDLNQAVLDGYYSAKRTLKYRVMSSYFKGYHTYYIVEADPDNYANKSIRKVVMSLHDSRNLSEIDLSAED